MKLHTFLISIVVSDQRHSTSCTNEEVINIIHYTGVCVSLWAGLDFIHVEAKVSLCSIKHHAMNMYGRGNLQLHATAVLATQFVKCRNDVNSPKAEREAPCDWKLAGQTVAMVQFETLRTSYFMQNNMKLIYNQIHEHTHKNRIMQSINRNIFRILLSSNICFLMRNHLLVYISCLYFLFR